MASHFFHPAALPSSSAFNDAHIKAQLQKWDVSSHMRTYLFRYTKYYHRLQAQELALDMFNDPKVQEVFQVLLKRGDWQPLSDPVVKVDVELVPATLTRLDIFDKLAEADGPAIVRPNGDIAKCMEDVRDGFPVCDRVRELLLCEESENAELYSDDEKGELLWRIFGHLVLGGACNQYEDRLEPYVEAAKRIYKDLLSAQKNATTGKIEVTSVVFRVKALETKSGTVDLFPAASRNSFCYVAVDASRRTARVWYHAHLPYW